MRSRVLAFAVLGGLCVVGAIVVTIVAVLGARNADDEAARVVRAALPEAARVLESDGAFVAFRALDRDDSASYTRFSIASLTDAGPGTPVPAGPSCVRLTYRAGRGMCLGQPGPTTFTAIALDQSMKEISRFSIAGLPSRTRISHDGRWAGVTAFVSGHSYTQPGQFSTVATILDLDAGKVLGDLEQDFEVTDAGRVVNDRDRNFWGLTFADDGDTFYATMASGNRTWLIRGSISGRTAETIHTNVECPSLSPDGTRIAYKKRVGRPGDWRFTVLHLASREETRLAETRSIDDQLEWLDDGHVLYGADETTYVLPTDGSGSPQVFVERADSPAVVRP
jgi:hypothetical protein